MTNTIMNVNHAVCFSLEQLLNLAQMRLFAVAFALCAAVFGGEYLFEVRVC